jgi:hypothetical protein
MPNGGPDNCATCWFNDKNKGESGYDHINDPEPNFCIIRNLNIANAFYTYCGNHAYRCPERNPIPIGPVLIASDEHDGQRIFWQPSPDTEEIRQYLLNLLNEIKQQISRVDQSGVSGLLGLGIDEIVIWQLGEFKEIRARSGLQEIANFDPTTIYPIEAEELILDKATGYLTPVPSTLTYSVQVLMDLAREAIVKIESV